MRTIHFILASAEKGIDTHLAGVTKIGADEVIVFSRIGNPKLDSLKKILDNMGVEYRIKLISSAYLDTFLKASEESIASLTTDSSLAINMSMDQCAELSALEDAIRVQVHFFHKRNDKAFCSGYRYYVRAIRPLTLDVIPFWNFQNQTHNDMLEILAASESHIGVNQLWEILRTSKENIEGREAFRKIFRDFRRWLRNTPCFSEQITNSPNYKIRLE